MDTTFDLVVIGGGPGGYVAAIRASQLGLKTACVEVRGNDRNEPVYGGVCLNVGCIPTKTLLDSSHKYYDLLNGYAEHGMSYSDVSLDLSKMMSSKESVVASITSSVGNLLKSQGVTLIQGWGTVHSRSRVTVRHHDGTHSELSCSSVILATGSTPRSIPGVQMDGATVVDSTGAISLSEIPDAMCIIGSGVIGLEIGSIWGRLGSKVTILEAQDQVLPQLDRDVISELSSCLAEQNVTIKTGVSVVGVTKQRDCVEVEYVESNSEVKLAVDKVVVAVGRRPAVEGCVSDSLSLKRDEKGFVEVDDFCQTSASGIYAIGDMVRGPMLAHKASEEGVMVAERIAGQRSEVSYDLIPSVIYTHPEVAWVGMLPVQAAAERRSVKVGSFSFKVIGRAVAASEARGMAKIVSCAETGTVVGAVIIGPNAGELIQSVTTAMEFQATAHELGSTVFAHPTFSEAIKEAALDCHGDSVHKYSRRKRESSGKENRAPNSASRLAVGAT